MSVKNRLITILFFVVSLFGYKDVYADDAALNLTISPTFLQFETKPGASTSTELKLRNNGKITENLRITIGKFKIDESGEKPELLDLRENDDTTLWIVPEKYEIELQPEKWESIKISFSPPEGAALSYYYVIYFTRVSQNIDPGNTNVVGSPAILVLTTVTSPNAVKELQLESFVAKNSFLEYLPQEFEIKIRNTGNVNVVPTGNIFIDSASNQDVGIISINPTSKVILPNSSRTFTATWEDGFPLKKDKLVWDLANASKFRIGRYTANVLLVYDNGLRDIPLESSLSFWVFPVTLVLIALFVLMLPALITFILMKFLIKKRESKVTQIHN